MRKRFGNWRLDLSIPGCPAAEHLPTGYDISMPQDVDLLWALERLHDLDDKKWATTKDKQDCYLVLCEMHYWRRYRNRWGSAS